MYVPRCLIHFQNFKALEWSSAIADHHDYYILFSSSLKIKDQCLDNYAIAPHPTHSALFIYSHQLIQFSYSKNIIRIANNMRFDVWSLDTQIYKCKATARLTNRWHVWCAQRGTTTAHRISRGLGARWSSHAGCDHPRAIIGRRFCDGRAREAFWQLAICWTTSVGIFNAEMYALIGRNWD